MNLLLRPLDNANDPVWSVIICVILAVASALFVVVYILREAFAELDNDGSNQPEGREPRPADSTPDTQD